MMSSSCTAIKAEMMNSQLFHKVVCSYGNTLYYENYTNIVIKANRARLWCLTLPYIITYHKLFFTKLLSTQSLGIRDPLAFTDSRVNFFLQFKKEKQKDKKWSISTVWISMQVYFQYGWLYKTNSKCLHSRTLTWWSYLN